MKLSETNHGINQYQGFKNKLINGNFNIWQRGTSFTAIADAAYSVDRFKYNKSGAMVHTITRDTSVPNTDSYYSIKLACTTIDSSIAATDFCTIGQRIEGYNFLPIVGKTATLSFYVKSSRTGTYCVSFRNSSTDNSYVVEYTINAANTWEKKIITLDFTGLTGGWTYTAGVGLSIDWVITAGANYQITADSWQVGNYLSTSNQGNLVDSITNNFWLSQVQFEIGYKETEFEHKFYSQELIECQRYYEILTQTISGASAANYSTTAVLYGSRYKVTKRATTPTWITTASVGTPTGCTGDANSISWCGLTGFGTGNFTVSVEVIAEL